MKHECNQREKIIKLQESIIRNDEQTSLINQTVIYMKEKLDKIEVKLDSFINISNKIYATRLELEEVKSIQRQFGRWLIGTLFTIILMLIWIIVNLLIK